MILKSSLLSLALSLSFYGCADGALHLKMQLEKTYGLSAGDPVVFENDTVGAVASVESRDPDGFIATLEIAEEKRKLATTDARFRIAERLSVGQGKQVEIVHAGADGTPLEEGATVQGTLASAPLFPFSELFGGMTEGLRSLREQTERFRRELKNIPDSDEARQLREEWRRLVEEIQEAQSEAKESLREEILPKLEEEMENLRKKFEEMKPKDPKRGPPLET
ncbi:MAG: MlaD family protein [Gammaproteobacteria bacterium]